MMSILRRYKFPGSVYFITTVTFGRAPILLANLDVLQRAIAKTRSKVPFELTAWVVMPDHLHAIFDPMDGDISDIMQRIKMSFAATYLGRYGIKTGRVWQNRFWDHVIRNQGDLNQHIDYIHYNPVKHGLTDAPNEHRASSFDSFQQRGYYDHDWGTSGEITFEGEYGE